MAFDLYHAKNGFTLQIYYIFLLYANFYVSKRKDETSTKYYDTNLKKRCMLKHTSFVFD